MSTYTIPIAIKPSTRIVKDSMEEQKKFVSMGFSMEEKKILELTKSGVE